MAVLYGWGGNPVVASCRSGVVWCGVAMKRVGRVQINSRAGGVWGLVWCLLFCPSLLL